MKAVVVVSTCPAEDVAPVWLCMLLLLVSCFGVVPGVQRLHFHPCGTCPLFAIPEHVLEIWCSTPIPYTRRIG